MCISTWGVSTAAAKKHRAAQRAVRRCIIKTEVGLTAQLAAVIKTLAKRQIAWICLPLTHTQCKINPLHPGAHTEQWG